MSLQELIALGIVAAAVGFLLYRAFRPGKSDCKCGCCKDQGQRDVGPATVADNKRFWR